MRMRETLGHMVDIFVIVLFALVAIVAGGTLMMIGAEFSNLALAWLRVLLARWMP